MYRSRVQARHVHWPVSSSQRPQDAGILPELFTRTRSPGDLGAVPKATQPQKGRTTLCAHPVCLQSPESSSCCVSLSSWGLSAGAVPRVIEEDSAGDPGTGLCSDFIVDNGGSGEHPFRLCAEDTLCGVLDMPGGRGLSTRPGQRGDRRARKPHGVDKR